MKEFIKRLGLSTVSLAKNIGITLAYILGIFLGYTILIVIPSVLIDQYTSINSLWWTIIVVIALLIFATWDSISEKIKWLIEPLKNKKEEDVE